MYYISKTNTTKIAFHLFLASDLVTVFNSPRTKFKMAATDFPHVCSPIVNNDDLLAFPESPATWQSLVEPLSKRCAPQKLGNDFHNIRNFTPVIIENEPTRPKVLVCHDLAGNCRDDR